MKKQILKNVFTNYAANFIGMVLGFLLVPFLILKLGKDAFGLIVLAESMIAFFELASVSVRVALSRYATVALAQGKKDDFIEYISTSRYLLWAVSLGVFLIGSVLAWFFPSLFQVTPALASSSKVLFFLLIFSFTVTIPNMIFWAILYSKNRFDLINQSISYGVILRAALVFTLFSVSDGKWASLTVYGLVYLLMICTQNWAIYFWHQKVMPGLSIGWSHFRMARAKEILPYSAFVGFDGASRLLYQNTANILINLFWGTSANAIYSIGTKFPQIVTRLFEQAAWALTSTFNGWVVKNDQRRIRLLFFMYTKAMALTITPICWGLILFSGPIIRMWVGPDFAPAERILPIATLPLFFYLPTSVCGCILASYGKVKVPSLAIFLVSVLNIGLSILLGEVFSMGVLGMALSWCILQTSYSILFAPIYACTISGIPLSDYCQKAFLTPFVWASLCSSAGWSLLGILAKHQSWVAAAAAFPLCLAVYVLGIYYFVLSEEEKRYAREGLREAEKILSRSGLFKGPILEGVAK